jgi:hypothetical protein
LIIAAVGVSMLAEWHVLLYAPDEMILELPCHSVACGAANQTQSAMQSATQSLRPRAKGKKRYAALASSCPIGFGNNGVTFPM